MKTRDDAYQAAVHRAIMAKRHMDSIRADLDEAEDEYHQAFQMLDEFEEQALPTAEDVRGILGVEQTDRGCG